MRSRSEAALRAYRSNPRDLNDEARTGRPWMKYAGTVVLLIATLLPVLVVPDCLTILSLPQIQHRGA